MKTAVIVNPASAGGKTGEMFASLQAAVDHYLGAPTIYFTQAPGHAEDLARQLAAGHIERLIGVGGDGTFNEIVNGLFAEQRAIHPALIFGTLPMGTGGDLIRSLEIPRSPRKALAELSQNLVVDSNVGHVALLNHQGQPIERYFINLFNFGVGGLTSILVNQGSKALGGRLSFMSGALKAMLSYKGSQVRMKVDGQVLYQGKVRNVALANGKYCGGGMYMAPAAELSSGQFQLVLFEDMPTARFIANMPRVYWGGHLRHKNIRSLFATSLEVESEDGELVYVDMDGETPGKLPIKATCLAKALRLNVGKRFLSQRAAPRPSTAAIL